MYRCQDNAYYPDKWRFRDWRDLARIRESYGSSLVEPLPADECRR